MRRQLPTLNVQSPCHESTSNMRDVQGGRHCFACDKTVVDLTEMSAREAEALFLASGEDLCGEVRLKPSGVPAFRPERREASPLRSHRAFVAAGAAAALMVGCGSVPMSNAPTAAMVQTITPSGTTKQANVPGVPEQASVQDDTTTLAPEIPTHLADDDAGHDDVDAGPPQPRYPQVRGRMHRPSR